MAGTKGIRKTPRDLEGKIYDLQMGRDKLGQTGFVSDNRIYKSGRNVEERRNRRHKDSPNRDAGDEAKRPQSRGSSRTPREKKQTTPSPRVGTIGSTPVEGRMQRKANSSRKKESSPQTNHSSSETSESSINKESLRMSLERSGRAPINSRTRTKATALVVSANDEDPKSDNVLQSVAERAECSVNKSTGMISERLVDKSNKVDGVLIEHSSSNAFIPYGDSASQTSLPIGKAMRTKAAGVSTGSRRNQKTQNTNKNPIPASPFTALAETPIAYKRQDSLKISSKITLCHETSLKSQASAESLTLWPKIQASRSEDVPHSSPIRLDRTTSKDQVKQNLAIDDRAKTPNKLKSSPSRAGKEDKEGQDNNGKIFDRTFGLSFGRKKSKNLDLVSPRSTTDSDIFSTKTKKSLKLPKLMRSLGKALGKRLLSADDNKARKLKSTLKKALGSRRSRSSDDASDTASSIDMNEIQVMNPELYTTILETVASWCEEPIAEPDAESEALSARTFSTISFRNRKGREKSQDLTNFDISATLAAEEAVLDETMREHQTQAPEADGGSDSEKDISTESDMTTLLNAVNKLCLPLTRQPSRKSPLIAAAPETTLRSQRLASFLELTDSDSEEEEDELAEKMAAVNSFLHLTSSEMEPFEVKGMKEVLRMQGIWLFDWERCKEMKSLSEEWHQSSCLRKYLSGGDGFEISLEGDKVLKTYPYPVEGYDHPVEKVFLDQVPQCSDSNLTLKIQGTLTTKGLRTTVVCAEDGSKRQELFCLDKQGLCVQVSSELANGKTNVSKVFLKRPT